MEKKAEKNGYIDSYDQWKNKANDSMPVWAAMEMLNDCYEHLDNKIEDLKDKIKCIDFK